MFVKHTTKEAMCKALRVVNERYDSNILFGDRTYGYGGTLAAADGLEERKGGLFFSLRVASLDGPGTSVHNKHPYPGPLHRDVHTKRTRSACWHVHGLFFDALLAVTPDAVIRSAGRRITKDRGNWEDWNAGSPMYPEYMSEMCYCEERGLL